MEKITNRAGEKVPLTQVFQALDRRLARRPIVWETFRIRVCGRLLELCFEDRDMRDAAMRSVQSHVVQEAGTPDAVFFYWYGVSTEILPEEMTQRPGVWESRDDTGLLKVSEAQMYGVDTVRRHFYFTRQKPDTVDYAVYGHTLVGLVSRWASESDLILLHAAAVGAGGKGVLVVGRGGSGKSTFSVSCMTEGMDFVSDDYTLISASGSLRAMPIYTTVAVNPDMYARLPSLGEPSVPPDAEWCNGKLQFFIPGERFAPELEIGAVVMPVIGPDDGEPAIRPIAPGAAMVQMLHTSAIQVSRNRDAALVRQMAQRLSGLPVYEMRMSRDLKKNPAALRRFIEKEL
ncbi:MAG: hypothetical protein E7443_03945 [Ruminococcaceae bacterium]|nr:hypothetical protein [Oscillospiraceae bacterium]